MNESSLHTRLRASGWAAPAGSADHQHPQGVQSSAARAALEGGPHRPRAPRVRNQPQSASSPCPAPCLPPTHTGPDAVGAPAVLGAPQQCLPGAEPAVQAAHTKPCAGPLQSWRSWSPFPTLRASVPWWPAERVSQRSLLACAPEPVGPPLGSVAVSLHGSSLRLGTDQLGP